ncbi:MAG: DUF3164 family protein [Desulfuromonadales bacterium]|nr:DUF3164 family protein [Desulfuromonadales bacterium]
MTHYSYSPHGGMQYHLNGKDAKEAADKAIRLFAHNSITDPEILDTITWGEVTERATPTGAEGFALKRQERLSYEAEHPQVVDGRMADCDGNLILVTNLHDADLLEHDMVLSVACIWENLSAKIARFKQHNFEDVTTFVDILFDRYAAKRGGSEGNMTFTTVDRKYKLQVAIQKAIAFGPEIEVAKTKMLEAVKEMSDSGDLETIVTATFTQIDGKLRVAEILRLRNYKISNKTWNEAVEIINAAIEVISAKKQIRLYRRSEQGQYDAVPLNIAAI